MAKKFRLTKKKTAPSKPMWKLEDGIQYSGLSLWQQCPEQFSLQYIDGITPKSLSIPLEFGSVIHYALENQFKATPHEVIHRVSDHYRKYRTATLKNSNERDTLNYILGLAEILFPKYCAYWEHDDKEMVWIGREEKFAVKHTVPNVGGEDREIILRGMRDGVFTDKTGEVFGVFETKTKVKVVEADIIDNLQYDMQTMLYCFVTYLTTGRYPNKIVYNVIRRPDLYRRKNESLVDFLQRTGEDIDSRPDHYFKRYRCSLVQDDIDQFKVRTLDPILRLFIQWWDSVKKNPTREERFQSPYHYLNSSALVGKYGKVEMWDAIFGDMSRYKIRSETFPELEDSFQVTWDLETKGE